MVHLSNHEDCDLFVKDHMKRCYQNNTLSDLKILVENQRLVLHRAILASSSPFLAEIFQGIRSSETIDVYLEGFSGPVVKKVLEFLYLGEVVLARGEFDEFELSLTSLGLESARAQFELARKNIQRSSGHVVQNPRSAVPHVETTNCQTNELARGSANPGLLSGKRNVNNPDGAEPRSTKNDVTTAPKKPRPSPPTGPTSNRRGSLGIEEVLYIPATAAGANQASSARPPSSNSASSSGPSEKPKAKKAKVISTQNAALKKAAQLSKGSVSGREPIVVTLTSKEERQETGPNPPSVFRSMSNEGRISEKTSSTVKTAVTTSGVLKAAQMQIRSEEEASQLASSVNLSAVRKQASASTLPKPSELSKAHELPACSVLPSSPALFPHSLVSVRPLGRSSTAPTGNAVSREPPQRTLERPASETAISLSGKDSAGVRPVSSSLNQNGSAVLKSTARPGSLSAAASASPGKSMRPVSEAPGNSSSTGALQSIIDVVRKLDSNSTEPSVGRSGAELKNSEIKESEMAPRTSALTRDSTSIINNTSTCSVSICSIRIPATPACPPVPARDSATTQSRSCFPTHQVTQAGGLPAKQTPGPSLMTQTLSRKSVFLSGLPTNQGPVDESRGRTGKLDVPSGSHDEVKVLNNSSLSNVDLGNVSIADIVSGLDADFAPLPMENQENIQVMPKVAKVKKVVIKTCRTCKVEIKGAKKYKEHLKIHRLENPFPCRLCAVRLKTRHGLRSHEKRKHDISDLKCVVCGTKFLGRMHRQQHVLACISRAANIVQQNQPPAENAQES